MEVGLGWLVGEQRDGAGLDCCNYERDDEGEEGEDDGDPHKHKEM